MQKSRDVVPLHSGKIFKKHNKQLVLLEEKFEIFEWANQRTTRTELEVKERRVKQRFKRSENNKRII